VSKSGKNGTGRDDGQGEEYKVGYKKPPLNSRFRKGTSGNPRGRRKNAEPRDMFKSVQQTFLREIPIREGDQSRSVPKVVALVERVLNDALRGDARAKSLAYKMAEVFGVFQFKDQTRMDLSMLTPEEHATVVKGFDVLRKAQVVLPSGHTVRGKGVNIFESSGYKPGKKDDDDDGER
jgi:hypothetical protein